MTSTTMMYFAFGLALIAASTSIWALLRAKVNEQFLNKQLANFNQRLQTATSGAFGMGQRILVLEEKIQTLNDAAMHSPDSDSATYTQAMQLFDRGADVNTVMASCGISSSEASLMALMRQQTTKNSRQTAGV